MADLAGLLDQIDAGLDESLERLFELLKIPSVSTDPAYAGHCRQAAGWLAGMLDEIGFEARMHDTPGHPVVVAHYQCSKTQKVPHILFYGHYDVQPPDPLDDWKTPPFEPTLIRDKNGHERIFARGAADDKGQLMTFLEAVRAMFKASLIQNLNMTVLLEGEEETGSPSLDAFLKQHRDLLSHDVALICDTGMWDETTPAITTRLRGICNQEVTITGPSIDLHSGLYGGAARNPVHVLAAIIAAMHDQDGRITIPGFYDGVEELPPATARQWAELGLTAEDFLGPVGLSRPAGEKDRSLLEQIWSRPTLEVNGIYGGYTGAGTKTVIPSTATAKFSFRLVDRQDPAALVRAFQQFVEDQLPPDCTARFNGDDEGSPAVGVSLDNPVLALARKALQEEFGKEPVMMGCGGSIPVVGSFKRILGMESILVGFGLADDAIHSPNEKYDVNSFHKGIRSWARILTALGSEEYHKV